jgi:hypothetical protein
VSQATGRLAVNPATSIPLLKDNEQPLLIMRERLENMFIDLSLIHDATVVCRAACDSVNSDTDAEVSHVLRRCCTDQLHSQMEELTSIIEQLGGRTDLSDDNDDDQEGQLEDSNEQ